jgi:hypothetical protein
MKMTYVNLSNQTNNIPPNLTKNHSQYTVQLLYRALKQMIEYRTETKTSAIVDTLGCPVDKPFVMHYEK